MLKTFARTVALGLAGVLAVGAANAKDLNFGIISTESQTNLQTVWTPFLEAMGQQTGYNIKPFFAPEYAGVITAMGAGKVDIAWYGNKSAMEAVDRANGEVFVQSVDVAGNPGYWSLLVTHKDSGITLDKILKCDKSLTFGNGDANSTSGFLVPSYYVFAVNKIDPANCFKQVTNAKHEANLFAVANKQVDFATNNTESLLRFQQNQADLAKNVKEIWRSPLIPSDPIVWRKDLDAETKKVVKEFFLGYGRKGSEGDKAEALKVLAGLAWAPFKESSDAQLYPIRQLELFKKRIKIEGDAALPADEKKAKLAEIDAQLEDLAKKMKEAKQG